MKPVDISKITKLVNLTGREIQFMTDRGSIEIRSKGEVRLKPRLKVEGHVQYGPCLLNILSIDHGEIDEQFTPMPNPVPGTLYIVTSMVRRALARNDVASFDRIPLPVVKANQQAVSKSQVGESHSERRELVVNSYDFGM